ncbi:MAG: hypothetical protein ABI112_11690 [Terracoccus sp.]
MEDRIEVSVPIPLDDDGFLRRQCPSCDRQFKWYPDQEDASNTEPADQYFCPLCGAAAGVDEWSTPEQAQYAIHSAGPTLDQCVQDAIADVLKGGGALRFEPNPNFSLELPDPEPLTEPNDMTAVIPPCHPREPVKVPEDATSRVHCLICGLLFAT